MASIKAIFFDVDGTLVSFRTHSIPESTKQAIAAAKAKGIKVFVATGRQYELLNNLEDLTFDGYVTVNGSIALMDGEIVYSHPIEESDILSLLRYQKEVEEFPCALVHEKDIYINYINEDAEKVFKLLNFPTPPITPLENIPLAPTYQLISFFRIEQEERIMNVLPNCTSTRWNDYFTDIVAKGSNKAVGISKVIERLGITREEIMAFGDGGNDLEMLEYAGIGVAMGNASEKTKAAADYITLKVDDGGVAHALKEFGVID